MKPRETSSANRKKVAEHALCEAFLTLQTTADVRAFLRDLCTPAELEAMMDRWRVVPLIAQGMSYRDIHARTGVSLTTIGRVARFLNDGHGGYAGVMRVLKTRE